MDNNPDPSAIFSTPVSGGCGPLSMTSDDGRPLRQQVFERVRAAGAIARIDLAKDLGVSPASVTTISAELMETGLIREVDSPRRDADAGRGRPPVSLGVNPEARHVAGLKLSDHFHSAVILDFAGNVVGRASLHRSRGAALMDLNGDGLLDLAVLNRHAPMELYQNITAGAGNWLLVDVTQDGINPNVVGAFVELRADGRVWTQEITIGGGHAGGTAGALHFGLGDIAVADIRVIWPNGDTGDWQPVEANRRVTLIR